MTAIADTHAPIEHGAPKGPRGWQHLTAPGFVRALWTTPLFAAIGLGLVLFFRWLGGYDPLWDWPVVTTVSLLTMAPLGFLTGIGAFDYWAGYVIGRPTPLHEDHSSHGAKSWRDYFRVNTDHKVIGIQYVVTTFVFFVIGGLLAMLMRAELAQPGSQYLNPQAFNDVVRPTPGS